MGFDGMEIALNSPDTLPIEGIKKKMAETGMECTFTATLYKSTNLISPDKTVRDRGVEFLKKLSRIVSELSSDVMGGVIYAAWGEFTGNMRTPEEWERSKEGLFQTAEYAQKYGVVLAVEPVNRFETYFLNTAEDAIRLLEEINHPNVRVHLDTYHLNIEEKNFYQSVKLAGEYLYHFHVCENDRGVPGTGHVDWCGVYKALKEINYGRWAIIESFVPAIEGIARQTAIWRHIAPSADAIAEEGLKFLKKVESKV